MDNSNPAKASRPLVSPSIAKAADILSRPGFVAFARVLGLRIAGGQSVDALAMLVVIGCPAETAHDIIDAWPTKETRTMPEDFVTLPEECACWLSHFIDDIDAYDWPALLVASARAAQEKRPNPS